jgi:AcrR family transcriptional regulator
VRGKRRRKPARRAPRRPIVFSVAQLKARGALLVKEIAGVGATAASPAERLERVITALFAAFDGEPLCHLLIEGWRRAQRQKELRLELAWVREQLRLSVEEVLRNGIQEGAFRTDLDPEATASVILGTAEGFLLQSVNQGGPVPAERLADTLLRAILRNPAERPGQT